MAISHPHHITSTQSRACHIHYKHAPANPQPPNPNKHVGQTPPIISPYPCHTVKHQSLGTTKMPPTPGVNYEYSPLTSAIPNPHCSHPRPTSIGLANPKPYSSPNPSTPKPTQHTTKKNTQAPPVPIISLETPQSYQHTTIEHGIPILHPCRVADLTSR